MKKEVFILSSVALILISAVNVKAQAKWTQLNLSTDTLNNADTSYHQALNVGYYEVVRFTFSLDKVSGTTAGTALLQGSGDGVHWFDLDSVLTFTNLTSQQRSVLVNPASWRNYRVRWYTSGTMKGVPKTQGYFIKP